MTREKIKNPVVVLYKRETSDSYAVAITDGSQNMHDGLLMASVSPDEADNSFAVFAMVGYYMAAEIEALRKRVSELEAKSSAEEAPSVAITLPANLSTEDLR
ncbi:hypothetical protein [Citrobacter freundii]|uniref:hypothetical protein n=1 Tax=Citrobacter freundii TaxID=546 RepID=UPI0015E97E5C|nr:hypothetical protein [Citrobacter freundii]QLU17429.1 hypothetical protein HV147_26745 [Citrobacter freundii]HCB1820697.1 hypothetical protein [Citrobacter freundii]HDX4036652.1 hypothetical protein [Citrobacter youngae]